MTEAQVDKQKRPTWLQGLFIGGAGIVLGVGGCAAFIAGLDSNSDVVGAIGAGVFVIGLVTAVVGGVWFIVGMVKDFAQQTVKR
jgi:hypothetical protein